MKKLFLFLLFCSILFSSENRILIHGLTSHFHSKDSSGYKYNSFNYGLGFEHTNYSKKNNRNTQFVLGYSINLISDSYKNPFFFGGILTELRYKINSNYSIASSVYTYIGYKKTDSLSSSTFKYEPIIGATPGLRFYFKNFSINYNFSPSITVNNTFFEGFHYLSFSYSF